MKNILLIAAVAVLLWACNDKSSFKINGQIVPAIEGSVILYGFEKGNPVPVDTSKLENGKFTFSGKIEMAELNLIGIEGQNRFVAQLFNEASIIDMTIYPDSFEANVIKGSKAHDIYQIYQSEIAEIYTNVAQLEKRFRVAQSTNNQEEAQAIQFEYETIVSNANFYAKNFVSKYNSSPVAVFVYLKHFFEEAESRELDSMLVVFEKNGPSDFISVIQERADLLRSSGNGAIAPDFTLNSPDGTPFTLSSLRGKYVLIDFWASWCQPCMIEMPNVIAEYQAYKDKGFEIVGVSLDRDRDAWLNTIKEKEMNWIHGWDLEGETPGAVADLYGVEGIPYTVLLDKEGRIIDKNLRGGALKARLSELMD